MGPVGLFSKEANVVSNLRQAFRPEQLLPSLIAGLVAGILTIIVSISLAALIFAGDLSDYVANGIGLTLFGSLVIGVVTALTSSYAGTVAVSQDSPAAVLALIAAGIVGGAPASASPQQVFMTVVAAILITSLLTGTFFFLLGLFKLGGLVRYMPYPVVGGFLAGTGWLLLQGAVGVMADGSLGLSQLSYLFQADVWLRWLPGALFAVLLLLILRRYSHFLVIPTMLLAAIGLFYLLLGLANLSVTEAGEQGWLLGPFPEGELWQPLTPADLDQVDWSLIWGQAGNVGTILIISVISLLLNASGLELTVQRDVDLDRELQATGLANVLAGLGGGPAGYHALSLSALGHRVGSSSRLTGLVSAGLCGLMLWAGASLLSYFPKPVLGGLLFFLGLAFLVEWVYDAWFSLSRADYLIVLLILVMIAGVGVLPGIGLGIVLALVLFAVSYSRVDVVKHSFSGATYRSRVERPRLYQQLLRQKGDWVYILELQGFIFFGTANKLLEQVRQRLDRPDLSLPRFILLDFRRVSGLDASAVFSFVKMKQLTGPKGVLLIFSHLSPPVGRQLEKQVFTAADRAAWRVHADLDHSLEWCEERMIELFESTGLTARPRTVRQQMERFLPRSTQFASLFEFLAREEGEGPEEVPAVPVGPASLDLGDYLERQDVPQGHCLIRQGEVVRALYFVETGQVTVQLERADGQTIRLRKMGAGSIVGEMGLYLGAQASASVVTDRPSTVYALSAAQLQRMEGRDPETAAAFHKFIAQLLSERLQGATQTLQALLD